MLIYSSRSCSDFLVIFCGHHQRTWVVCTGHSTLNGSHLINVIRKKANSKFNRLKSSFQICPYLSLTSRRQMGHWMADFISPDRQCSQIKCRKSLASTPSFACVQMCRSSRSTEFLWIYSHVSKSLHFPLTLVCPEVFKCSLWIVC